MQNLVGVLLAAVSLLLGPAVLRADNPAWRELPESVDGYGELPDAAMKAALANAREAVWQYLSANYPEIRDKPSREYLLRNQIVVPESGQPSYVRRNGVPVWHAVYRLNKLTNQHLSELRDSARVPWVSQRHRQAALVLFGLVLALLVLMGFLRLDEATHGYYSGRLLGVAVMLVTLAIVALWWWW